MHSLYIFFVDNFILKAMDDTAFPEVPAAREGAMVDLTVRLPRRVAARLAEVADDWNVPIQALVLTALQAEFSRLDPAE